MGINRCSFFHIKLQILIIIKSAYAGLIIDNITIIMKEYKRKFKKITEFNIPAYQRKPDLRLLPAVLRKFIKFRVLELSRIKWKSR